MVAEKYHSAKKNINQEKLKERYEFQDELLNMLVGNMDFNPKGNKEVETENDFLILCQGCLNTFYDDVTDNEKSIKHKKEESKLLNSSQEMNKQDGQITCQKFTLRKETQELLKEKLTNMEDKNQSTIEKSQSVQSANEINQMDITHITKEEKELEGSAKGERSDIKRNKGQKIEPIISGQDKNSENIKKGDKTDSNQDSQTKKQINPMNDKKQPKNDIHTETNLNLEEQMSEDLNTRKISSVQLGSEICINSNACDSDDVSESANSQHSEHEKNSKCEENAIEKKNLHRIGSGLSVFPSSINLLNMNLPKQSKDQQKIGESKKYNDIVQSSISRKSTNLTANEIHDSFPSPQLELHPENSKNTETNKASLPVKQMGFDDAPSSTVVVTESNQLIKVETPIKSSENSKLTGSLDKKERSINDRRTQSEKKSKKNSFIQNRSNLQCLKNRIMKAATPIKKKEPKQNTQRNVKNSTQNTSIVRRKKIQESKKISAMIREFMGAMIKQIVATFTRSKKKTNSRVRSGNRLKSTKIIENKQKNKAEIREEQVYFKYNDPLDDDPSEIRKILRYHTHNQFEAGYNLFEKITSFDLTESERQKILEQTQLEELVFNQSGGNGINILGNDRIEVLDDNNRKRTYGFLINKMKTRFEKDDDISDETLFIKKNSSVKQNKRKINIDKLKNIFEISKEPEIIFDDENPDSKTVRNLKNLFEKEIDKSNLGSDNKRLTGRKALGILEMKVQGKTMTADYKILTDQQIKRPKEEISGKDSVIQTGSSLKDKSFLYSNLQEEDALENEKESSNQILDNQTEIDPNIAKVCIHVGIDYVQNDESSFSSKNTKVSELKNIFEGSEVYQTKNSIQKEKEPKNINSTPGIAIVDSSLHKKQQNMTSSQKNPPVSFIDSHENPFHNVKSLSDAIETIEERKNDTQNIQEIQNKIENLKKIDLHLESHSSDSICDKKSSLVNLNQLESQSTEEKSFGFLTPEEFFILKGKVKKLILFFEELIRKNKEEVKFGIFVNE